MSESGLPNQLAITVEGICNISMECWRLRKIAEAQTERDDAAGVRHAVRRISDVLSGLGIEVIDFSGRAYDPGLVPEVIEVRLDDTLSKGRVIIHETVAPTVMWRGQVVSRGQIVVRQSPDDLGSGEP